MAVKKSSAKKPRVLIVDDSQSVLDRIGAMLEKAGFEAVTADHSPKAIELLEKSLQPGQKPFTAVLSDYDLFVYWEKGNPITDAYDAIAEYIFDKKMKIPMVVMSSEDRTGQVGWMEEKVVKKFLMQPREKSEEAGFVRNFKQAISQRTEKKEVSNAR